MQTNRSLHLLLAALALAACEDAPRSALDLADATGDLEFTLPGTLPGTTSFEEVDLTLASSAPARMSDEDINFDPEAEERPASQIFNPATRVGFETGFAYAFGRHNYIGNIGEIDTTVDVIYQNQQLGDYTASKRNYTPFLMDFGSVKLIWAQAKVFTDHTCGLQVSGHSRHGASWEFFQGGNAPGWGAAYATTQAQPESQPNCQRATGGGTIEEHYGDGGIVCIYDVVYYLDTLEIVSATLITCSTVTGELI